MTGHHHAPDCWRHGRPQVSYDYWRTALFCGDAIYAMCHVVRHLEGRVLPQYGALTQTAPRSQWTTIENH